MLNGFRGFLNANKRVLEQCGFAKLDNQIVAPNADLLEWVENIYDISLIGTLEQYPQGSVEYKVMSNLIKYLAGITQESHKIMMNRLKNAQTQDVPSVTGDKEEIVTETNNPIEQ